MPEATTRVTLIDTRTRTNTDPCTAGRIVFPVEMFRWTQELSGSQVFRNDEACEHRWMKFLRCLFGGPLKCWKDLRRIDRYLVFVVHEGDKVVPDVEDGFHVITTLLHQRVAVLPTETNETDATFDAQSCFFQSLGGFSHARSGADGVIDDDHGLIRIDNAFDQLERTMLLAFFANQ